MSVDVTIETESFQKFLDFLGSPGDDVILEAEHRYAAGARLFRTGAVADRFYFVLEGTVSLHEHEAGPPLQTVSAGQMLGWSWLVPPYLWRFNAIAAEPTRVAILDGRLLRHRCDEDHELATRLFQRVSQMIAHRLAATSHVGDEGTPPDSDPISDLLGETSEMCAIRRLIPQLAASPAPVMVSGESGTGKELVARALHFAGPRRGRRFVAENCAALPESLLESELFGCARGAFTGATRDKPGLFEVAHGGTLFLDEIADASHSVQAKLLRVLETGELRRLGETEPRRVDVRVVAATSADLRSRLGSGRFRPELYYRLGVLTVELPPLRKRHEDVPLLAHNFLSRFCHDAGRQLPGFSSEALAELQDYAWPGNVRELRNEVERAATLAEDGATIGAELLSTQVHEHSGFPCQRRESESLVDAMQRIKARMIGDALTDCDGNLSRTARVLGVSRSNLQSTMRRLGLR